MSYERVEFYEDLDEQNNTGWWIVYYDDDGTQYDAIGPYDNELTASILIGDEPTRTIGMFGSD